VDPLARENNRGGTPLPQKEGGPREGKKSPLAPLFQRGEALLGMITLSLSQSRRAVWEWPRMAFHMALFYSAAGCCQQILRLAWISLIWTSRGSLMILWFRPMLWPEQKTATGLAGSD
jgi:hypothetical protein